MTLDSLFDTIPPSAKHFSFRTIISTSFPSLCMFFWFLRCFADQQLSHRVIIFTFRLFLLNTRQSIQYTSPINDTHNDSYYTRAAILTNRNLFTGKLFRFLDQFFGQFYGMFTPLNRPLIDPFFPQQSVRK